MSTPDPDRTPTPDEQRATTRARWERGAAAWTEQRAWIQSALDPVSHAMIDAISPQPGHVILEAAAGLGDTGLLAAELVHPGGRVILADGAEAMVSAARKNAEDRGVHNVEVTPMELEWIDMSAASLDGLLVRFGYMLVPDPEAGLRDARRVLRPGGRIALAVWDRAETNPWVGAAMDVLRERGYATEWPPPTSVPNMFALASSTRVVELLGDTGFVLPAVDRIDVTFRSASAREHRERVTRMTETLGNVLEALAPDVRRAVEAEIDTAFAAFADPDGPEGSVAVPGSVLVAAADA